MARSSVAKAPIMKVSRTRNTIMYSFTRLVIDPQLERITAGISTAVSGMNSTEMPSTPMR